MFSAILARYYGRYYTDSIYRVYNDTAYNDLVQQSIVYILSSVACVL